MSSTQWRKGWPDAEVRVGCASDVRAQSAPSQLPWALTMDSNGRLRLGPQFRAPSATGVLTCSLRFRSLLCFCIGVVAPYLLIGCKEGRRPRG